MSDAAFTFIKGEIGARNLANDERLKLLAVSIARQQQAGFRQVLDLRQFACPECRSPGFNTGWGFIAFMCGAEQLTGGEGEMDKPCPLSGPTPEAKL